MTDAIPNLALSLVANPGAYVIVIGSGVSSAAGIPTGWEVVEALITKLAIAAGEPAPETPSEWYEDRTGAPPTYTSLIESVAPGAAERVGLLTSFFEATPAELELGLKQPTKGHRAIAELVKTGVVRVIVTTNFDRLMEGALSDAGVAPTVVSSDDDVSGLPPLTQVRCLVVKAHGDYKDTRIKNTPDEVATLDPEIGALLSSLFGDYGVLVSGWSADYDAGLRDVLASGGAGSYGRYWTTRSDLGDEAEQLANSIDARVVRARDADSLFSSLLESVKSVQDFTRRGPIEDELAVATAKRLLVAPDGVIRLDDLLSEEVERIHTVVEGPRPTAIEGAEDFRDWLGHLEGNSRQLARLNATIGHWGSMEQVDLLERGLGRLSRWGIENGIAVVLKTRLYPPLLCLYAAGIAAIDKRNYGTVAKLLRTRLRHTESRHPGDDPTAPMPLVLNGPAVLEASAINGVLNIDAERRTDYHTPASLYLSRVLRPLVADVIPGEAEFEESFDLFEALLAMRYIRDGGRGVPTGVYATRGQRGFVGRGVPEQMQAEMEREGSDWWPISSGLFDSVEEAETALTGLQSRLNDFDWR